MKRTQSVVLGMVMTAALLLAIGCDAEGSGGSSGYEIGDTGPSGVGIVFYVTDGGLHGLEAAPSDQSASQVWIEGGSTQSTAVGSTGTSIGYGLDNTDAIIAMGDHEGSAAKLCQDYRGGDLTDWFLPSKDELNQLYLNKDIVGGFSNADYWASSEQSAFNIWFQCFDNGSQGCEVKNETKRVRAIRAF